MKLNAKRISRIPLLLGLVMLLAVILAACVNVDNVEEILDTSKMGNEISQTIEESEEEISTPEGYTPTPKVMSVVNITPTTIAVSGKCVEGATVRVSGGAKDVETVAIGEYFILEVELLYQNNLLKITAQAGDDQESLEGEFIARYNATAETRLDGNSVSVGIGSRLYFDKHLASMNAENIYTESRLGKIRDYVSNTVTSYYNDRAVGQDAEIIYVLIPNMTTIYPEIIPEENKENVSITVYDQILSTLNNTRATVIDMREVFNTLIADEEAYNTVMEEYGGIYRVTDSALTDYGAYLTYSELMNVVAERFPDAAPRATEEFEWNKVTALGGNLVNYRELDSTVVTEDIIVAKPTFSLSLGTNAAGSSSIASLKKFVNDKEGDYNYFTTNDTADGINGVAERWLIDTARTDVSLPNALIYRDYASLSFIDILAERFNKCMIAKSGEFEINLSNCAQYAADGKNAVDYIIVLVSEENMDNAFNLAFAS